MTKIVQVKVRATVRNLKCTVVKPGAVAHDQSHSTGKGEAGASLQVQSQLWAT